MCVYELFFLAFVMRSSLFYVVCVEGSISLLCCVWREDGREMSIGMVVVMAIWMTCSLLCVTSFFSLLK